MNYAYMLNSLHLGDICRVNGLIYKVEGRTVNGSNF